MNMGHRQKLTAAEYDAFTGWRHVFCYLQHAGVRSQLKRRARRRERHQARQDLRREQD